MTREQQIATKNMADRPLASGRMVPGRLPVLGHAIKFHRAPFEFLAALAQHGDLVKIRMGPRRAFVMTSPELVWQVLADSRTFDKGGPVFEKMRYYLGNGLATSDHETHRRQRRQMNPLFHHERLPGYVAVARDVANEIISDWQDDQVIDVTNAMVAMTTRITALTLAKAAMDEATINEVGDLYADITEGVYKRTVAPLGLLTKLPTPANHRYERACARMWNIADSIIDAYQKNPVDHGDMLSVLIATRDEHGNAIEQRELRDQVIILITGAIETLGTTLAWTFHLIGQHPEIESRLHEEIDRVLQGRPATWDDIPGLQLTSRVVTESMRMWPPTWLLTRQTTCDTTLAGHPISAGTTVMFSPYMIHHREDIYPDAERFDPDRWQPEFTAGLPRGAFIPFAGGGRKCIAEKLSIAESTVILATIIARWRLESIPDVSVRPVLRAILRPNALPMRLRERRLPPPSKALHDVGRAVHQPADALPDRHVPHHLGVILDGNRRWARDRALAPIEAYRVGAAKVPEFLSWCERAGIAIVSLWALSSDNLRRERAEVDQLLTVITGQLEAMAATHRWRLRLIGDLDLIPAAMAASLRAIEKTTCDAPGILVNIAVGYSGRDDVLTAVDALLAERRAADATAQDEQRSVRTSESLLGKYLSTSGQPDPDLIIRTSGERRTSGFLLWQAAQSELHFTTSLWPDFQEADLLNALEDYRTRTRRFGS